MTGPKHKFTEMKVKLKSLAAEASIIRLEEKKALTQASWYRKCQSSETNHASQKFNILRNHRVGLVRQVTRHNHLAYGLLKGIHYSNIESKCNIPPNLKDIARHAKKFAERGSETMIKCWIMEAAEYLIGHGHDVKIDLSKLF